MQGFRTIVVVAAASLLAGCIIDLPERSLTDGTSPREAGASRDGDAAADARADPDGSSRSDADGPPAALCGNGRVDVQESCDTAIVAGQPGACPQSCDDSVACTRDELLDAGTCRARCTSSLIDVCVNDDGCCPSTCDASSDNDCSSNCGNGTVDSKETCDKAIAAGDVGACPQSCPSQICKVVTLAGSATQCSAECVVINASDGATCSGGRCVGGVCCTGCRSGGTCRADCAATC